MAAKCCGGWGGGRSAGKSPLGTGHIQENNVVGRSRKRVRSKGRSRENQAAGEGRAEGSRRFQARDENDCKCHPQYFLSPKPRDPRYRTQSQAGGGKVGEGRSSDSLHGEVPEKITPRPRPRRREGSERRAGRFAPRPAAATTSLAAPFPSRGRAGRRKLPLESSASRSRWKGRTEEGRESRGGAVVQAGRKRGGGCTGAGNNWPFCTRLQGGERAREGFPWGGG